MMRVIDVIIIQLSFNLQVNYYLIWQKFIKFKKKPWEVMQCQKHGYH